MRLLGIDTSSLACTVGVVDGDRVVERYEEQPRAHTRILMPMIRSVLDEAGLAPGDLDAIALGNGPGSFIGMRIGTSVAQGLAYGAGIGIVPVSSMAVVAAEAGAPGDTVVVAQDAHVSQVYLGLYRIDDDGLPSELAPERLQDLVPISGIDAMAVAAGAGFERYPELLSANRDRIRTAPEVLYPRAGELLRLAAAAFEQGAAMSPEAVSPAYIRRDVAARPGPPTP